MAKFKTISTRISDDQYEIVEEQAGIAGMTISEFLTSLLDTYAEMEELTWEDLEAKDWDELCEFIEDSNLDTDPDDFPVRPFTTKKGREGKLRRAIALETITDLEGVPWDDIVELIDDLGLDIDPDNYDTEQELNDAIDDELESIEDSELGEEEED